MAGNHAVLSPSSADRWMLCPGSVALSKGLPDTPSAYADEGTAAHFLMSEAMLIGIPALTFIGDAIAVASDGARWAAYKDVREYPLFTVDEDMARHVQNALDHVAALAVGATEVMSEQVLSIEHLTGEEGATGTSDVVIIGEDEIIIADLKYGMGNRVDAKDNRQLMIYALAAVKEHALIPRRFDSVRLVILQPRLNHVSEWVLPVGDLMRFAETVKERAFHALALIDSEKPEALIHHLKPGDSQCKWCRAKAICPALDTFVEKTTGCDFEDLTETPAPTVEISTDSLAAKLQAVGLIEDWCKAIRAEAEARLFSGQEVPGFKLVQGKKGNRAWSNVEEAEALLKKMRVQHDKMYDYKLISPTTAEKLAKAEIIGPRQWPKVAELIAQAPGKPSVAPVSDPRPALEIGPSASDFDAVSEKDLI